MHAVCFLAVLFSYGTWTPPGMALIFYAQKSSSVLNKYVNAHEQKSLCIPRLISLNKSDLEQY